MPQGFSFSGIGTHWYITIFDEIDEKKLEMIKQDIFGFFSQFDKTYSRFIPTSLIWQIAEKTGEVEVPEALTEMLSLYEKLYLPSGRKLNPLIGFTISDLGYDKDYSFNTKKEICNTPDLLETIQIIDSTHISLSEKVLIDLGALGKGYLIDLLTKKLRAYDLRHFMIDGSGDVYLNVSENARIGLEHPTYTTKVIGMIELKKGAICSSANNRRTWGSYGHTIDPHTQTTPSDILATWVICDSAALADGLATALFMAPPENFAKDFMFQYVILNKDMKVKKSEELKIELY